MTMPRIDTRRDRNDDGNSALMFAWLGVIAVAWLVIAGIVIIAVR